MPIINRLASINSFSGVCVLRVRMYDLQLVLDLLAVLSLRGVHRDPMYERGGKYCVHTGDGIVLAY